MLSLCCWAFAWLNDCANGDEADFTYVQTQKTQSLYYLDAICILSFKHYMYNLNHYSNVMTYIIFWVQYSDKVLIIVFHKQLHKLATFCVKTVGSRAHQIFNSIQSLQQKGFPWGDCIFAYNPLKMLIDMGEKCIFRILISMAFITELEPAKGNT